MTQKQFVAALKAAMASHRHTQRDVADATGVHQSQVSRFLKGEFVRLSSDSAKKLAKYAEIKTTATKDPRDSRLLMDAIESVWDGSKRKEAALAKFIRDLSALI